MTTRRDTLRLLLALGPLMAARAAGAQRRGIIDTSNFSVMDQSAALPVRRPAKPGGAAALDPEGVNALERRIRCQCGCPLDLYTCRTTDLVCQVAPAMHRDVLALARGGYSAEEILDAFREVYGDAVFMSPPADGFHVAAYSIPMLAMAAGAIALTIGVRRRLRRTDA